jgi:hypothetical protein
MDWRITRESEREREREKRVRERERERKKNGKEQAAAKACLCMSNISFFALKSVILLKKIEMKIFFQQKSALILEVRW